MKNILSNRKCIHNEALIELNINQLLNQLVFQSICPHFILNYNYTLVQILAPESIAQLDFFLYNEIVNNVTSFNNFLKKNKSKKKILNAYFQILVSLYCMDKFFNLKHLDLHGENILVKKVKKRGYWEYIIDNKTYYLPNLGFVLYINDFGHGYIPKKFASWYAEDLKLKYNNLDYNDINYIFDATKKYYTKDIKKYISNNIIKNLEDNGYLKVICSNFLDLYNKKKILSSDTIETYNIDKKFSVEELPQSLHSLYINKKRI